MLELNTVLKYYENVIGVPILLFRFKEEENHYVYITKRDNDMMIIDSIFDTFTNKEGKLLYRLKIIKSTGDKKHIKHLIEEMKTIHSKGNFEVIIDRVQFKELHI